MTNEERRKLIKIENGVAIDERNNRAAVNWFGSEENAILALLSCSGCYGCSRCSDCSDCSGCSGCYDCSGCSRCSDCSRCSRCSRCSGCFRCSGCYGCSRCSDCSGCYGCSRCSDCSDCSDCSGCYDCSGCFRCSDLSPQKTEAFSIPAIDNIHQKIYEAASKPDAFCMSSWHKCKTVHCRAGWTVVLAGKEGKELEEKTSTLFAAMQIYKKSGYEISPRRFFDSDDVAMADMKRLAELEKQTKETA